MEVQTASNMHSWKR